MEQFDRFSGEHEYSARVGAAMVYAVAASIALNYFWTPGHIYSSGFTGLAQLLNTVADRLFGIPAPVYILYLILNIPLLVFSWIKIGHRFTFFSGLAIALAALAMRVLHGPDIPWVKDPLVDAIFGGALNGFGTGLALRNGLSTGGLDIIGILVRRWTGMKMGAANLTFNFFILLGSGILFGPEFALYTGIGLVVNARVIDLVYTRQQKLQVMIVTENECAVVDALQNKMRRGITIIHGAEGGFNHHNKDVLFTVISQHEQYDLQDAIHEADPVAWASAWRIDRTFGRFFEPRL
ncbi:putative membrane protein [Weissella oryzae SG25]|uniref:Putative membrane protein n=1 Tax=Weissella oryzae (strain DSM 25784 / JCM 18191 / LMG 30913 / SG25) TaxID=1329250 RepID=A0A069CSA7_WEIOS|nr:YitT family protein [Weissella oryzae]GAK30262.1 putative membrane protein [Weissella oryzae SG25]